MSLRLLYIITWLILFTAFKASAQDFKVDFRAQGNKDEVRLLWKPLLWADGLQGFNIKRKKDEQSGWQQLNAELIVPSTELLDNRVSDNSISGRLRTLRDSLVALRQMRLLTPEEMQSVFLQDEQGIKYMGFFSVQQFYHGLIYGFGYYDKDIAPADKYTYGLFPVLNGVESAQPYDTYEWKYGSVPDMSLDMVTEVRRLKKKKGLAVYWKTSAFQALEKNIKGFNIFQEDSLGKVKKVNDRLIRINLDLEDVVLTFNDPDYDLSKRMKFFVTPVDDHDYVGERFIAEYTPGMITELRASDLTAETSDTKVLIRWEFPEEKETEILGFRVLRRNFGGKFELLYEGLPVAREYEDDSVVNNSSYDYKIETILASEEITEGVIISVTLTTEKELPAPANLRGAIAGSGSNRYIKLEWDDLPDSVTFAGYQLYVGKNSDELAYLGSIPLLDQNNYLYKVRNIYGRKFQFAVRALDETDFEGQISDTITVYSPSVKLPEIGNISIEQTGDEVALSWEYDYRIDDLAGFNIYRNGILVAEAGTIDQARRSATLTLQEPGKYLFTIEAITRFNVRSPRSAARRIEIN